MRKNKKGNKVSIIGAGNVGAMLAQRILEHDLANIILVDIDEGISKGKACDLQDASHIIGYEKQVEGTADYSKMKDSNIVVITAGFPRKPGMSRDDLIQKNGAVIKDISSKIKEVTPDSVIIVVTNPLDIMSYLVYKVSGCNRSKVIGMAGILDAARCSNLTANELGIMPTEVDNVIIGSHDNNMVPLFAYSKAQGKLLKDIFDDEKRRDIAEKTRKRGAEIISLLKSGSAFFAPSAACFSMVKSILNNELLTLCASVYLDGEYGLKDIFIGVPVILGKKGIDRIVELKLTADESRNLKRAAESVRDSIGKLGI